jgi:DNA-binding transcriptional LysR family regulator
MDIRRIDLNLLTVLAALLDEESVSRAGKRIGLSQPAVSAALGRLRTVFGDELFIRTSHGLVPTQKAETLKPEVKAAVDQISRVFVLKEQFAPKESSHSFRISIDEFVGTALVPTLSTQIHNLAPLVRVEWLPTSHLADISRDLASGDLDFTIRVAAFSPP